MATHISARIAWHNDGWNGHICTNPAENTYCVGCHSYPGEMIRERRNLAWEQANAGKNCAQLEAMPPCMYSINAFGKDTLRVFADPPDWWGKDNAKKREWDMPPATVCIWPYEQMYGDAVENKETGQGKFNYEERLKRANDYFAAIQPDHSLIFYYANYSNPFSEDEQKQYVIVGLSRVKKVGALEYYEDCTPDVKQKYAGGFVWQRNITSHFPDEGFCLPYHRYHNDPDTLAKIVFVPDNPRNFKFGTRDFSDDEALNLVERFLEIAGTLQEMGDTSENWAVRIAWLQSLIGELWQARGLYPGMTGVLDYLGFTEAIPFWKTRVETQQEKATAAALRDFLQNKAPAVAGLDLPDARAKQLRRAWALKIEPEQCLLADIFPRYGLSPDNIKAILAEDRAHHSITATLDEIAANPYLISEQYIGNSPDDVLPFYRIDHGMFPSPDLGEPSVLDPDDPRRLRALCVEQLKRETKHTFLPAANIIHAVNHRLSFLPEWKRRQFTEKYIEVDAEELAPALTTRHYEGRNYLYWKPVYEAERAIETQIRQLTRRPDIVLKAPVTTAHWHNYLYNPESELAQGDPSLYDKAIGGQAAVCQGIFLQPISILSGSAGTGKTTIIKAIIEAIEKAHGAGTSFCLLAPTGKAAERIRSATGKDASTVHSFLAKRGWLNGNMTFKAEGGQKADNASTYIIDEASMLDLELMAALFRAIKWSTVQRLIFVGDQNQLPPIGRGRVFADIMDWLSESKPESVAVLTTNIRQMANRIKKRGTGILELASVFERTPPADKQDHRQDGDAEQMLRRLQEGGDIDKDLRVLFWDDADTLATQLTAQIVSDMEVDTGQTFDPYAPNRLWNAAQKGTDGRKRADYYQILSPYRGEPFGTENLNKVVQQFANKWSLQKGNLSGVAMFDKVIQVVNRPQSNPVWAFNQATKKSEKINVYNGEIGFAEPTLADCKTVNGKAGWRGYYFRVKHLHIVFDRNPEYRVEANGESFIGENLELGYAVSTHKAQGSEFERVYFVLPQSKTTLLSREMFYTGITRASRHCTLFIERDIAPVLTMYRPESSALIGINASLFQFRPVPDAILNRKEWYAEGKIHHTLANVMVRSKSEVIIANMLHERDIPFLYEAPLYAPDGTFYLPDFTITWNGEQYYWEHLGMLDEKYKNHWETKKHWYNKNFPGRLRTTEEAPTLSHDAKALIDTNFI